MKDAMESNLSSVAAWLESSGPYGLIAVLGWAFWAVNEKKDAALRELYDKVLAMGQAQTEAVTKMEAALLALRQAIEELRHKLQ